MKIEVLEAGRRVGQIEYHLASDELEIIDIEVSEDLRRRGIGMELVQKMILASPKAKKIFLEVRVGNIPALAFYAKLGFEKISVRKKYYSNGEDAICMVKNL